MGFYLFRQKANNFQDIAADVLDPFFEGSQLVVLLSADFSHFFSNKYFKNTIWVSVVWIKIITNSLSVLIWVQTVCKGYQQTTKPPLALIGAVKIQLAIKLETEVKWHHLY